MTVPRSGHTATLLQNGKVLICGGFSGYNGTVWASAELYDLKTRTFGATGDMTTPRLGHTATLLPDGRVLIAGGRPTRGYTYGQNVLLRSAELYDPASGKFTVTANMTTERIAHSATLLNDGRVLITGGGNFIWVNMWFSSAELYDPVTATFTATGSMTIERAGPTATLLPGGKVLVAGGDSGDDGPIPTVEIYDPGSGLFSFAGATGPWSSLGPTIMSALPNGKVLMDMMFYDGPSANAQLYDPVTMTFTPTGSMTAQRYYSTTLLSTGTVLAAGSGSPSADVYDPASGTFSATGGLITPRVGHTATLLPDGTVLLTGGATSIYDSTFLSSTEVYHPPKVAPAPVLYSLPGTTQGSILHAGTNRVVSASDPAVSGEALEIYGAGLLDGSVIPPQVVIGGRVAEVLFFGKAPGYAGVNQINVWVPSGVASGRAVPVRLSYLGRSSNEVTIDVEEE
jgi:WD40 repeat protein